MTTRPLILPAHVPGGDGHRLWKLPVGSGNFVGPRDQVVALEAELAVHAEQVAAVRVAEAREADRDAEYERWLPVLARRYPKYLDGVIPAYVTERYQKENA